MRLILFIAINRAAKPMINTCINTIILIASYTPGSRRGVFGPGALPEAGCEQHPHCVTADALLECGGLGAIRSSVRVEPVQHK